MNYVTKYMSTYQVSFDGFIFKVHGLPSHFFLANTARIFGVPLERVRVKFFGFIPVLVPLYDNVDLPF